MDENTTKELLQDLFYNKLSFEKDAKNVFKALVGSEFGFVKLEIKKENMSDKSLDQKLVGYIVYQITSTKSSNDGGITWPTQALGPTVHWKKKIYLTESSAKEAAKHIEEYPGSKNRAVIVPVYANRWDLDAVSETWKVAKVENEHKNKSNGIDRYSQIIDDAYFEYRKAYEGGKITEGNIYFEFGGEYSCRNYNRREFVKAIISNKEFSEKCNLKIEKRELTFNERYELHYGEKLHIDLKDEDWESEFVELTTTKNLNNLNVPTKLTTVTYKNEKIEVYE